jgi:protein-disulfide isomerase
VSKKAWIIFAVICVAVLGGLVYASNRNKLDVSNVDTNALSAASEASGNIADHVFGKADSQVVLYEYGDYQCPGCGSAYPTVKKLTEKYQGQIAFVFRNFPIASKHPNARAASAAAEAAGLQGKFWEMHDLLYENQAAWQSLSTTDRGPFFVEYAKQLGLDEARFKKDVESTNVSQKINFDQAVGKKAGADATPTFVLNGKKFSEQDWSTEQKFEEVLTNEMKAKGIELPQ